MDVQAVPVMVAGVPHLHLQPSAWDAGAAPATARGEQLATVHLAMAVLVTDVSAQ